MSVVEARLALHLLGEISIGSPTQEEVDAGAENGIELHFPIGIPVPVGPSQAIGAPLGVLSLKLSKSEAQEFFAKGAESADNLPADKPKADILMATSMADVTKTASNMEKFTKG